MSPRWFVRASLLLLLALLAVLPLTTHAQDDEPLAQGGTAPTVLVTEDVGGIDVQGAKAWWWFVSPCAPTLDDPASVGAWHLEEISRIPTMGGLIRTLFSHDEPSPYCGDWSPELLSNVVADEDWLFWMSNEHDGLTQLSVEANLNDPATPLYTGQSQADEIAERGDYVYLMDDAYGIQRVNKGTGAATTIVTAAQLGGASRDLQLDEDYVYWNQNGFLKLAWQGGGGGNGIATGVTGYVPNFFLCIPGPCDDFVLVAQGEQIRNYNIDDGTFGPVLYDSPVSGAVVGEMAVNLTHIFFWERRTETCNPFCTYRYGLYRMPKSGGTPELLYFLPNAIFGSLRFDLTIGGPSGGYLFWTDSGQLKRLPRDVAAIPQVNVAITNVEVTQSIQDLSNSVQLVQGKRTGVRVHVDAAGQDVPGISARLYRVNGAGTVIAGPLYPSPGSLYLTVPNVPDRATFDHAFYFELPEDWIDDGSLRLRAEVNPNQIPPEPTYADNVQTTPTFTLRASPTLRTHLLVWGYTVDGTYYQPDMHDDVHQARSWIRRVYPLASTTGGYESPDPGFRLKTRIIPDANLGGHVQRTSSFCLDMPEEDREFCAATYANNCAKWLRATEGIPSDELIYSMIWNDPGLPFPRGFATGGVSAGPTGPQTWGWDNDGSSGDWYMGHEVGHNVGRAHPSQGNACGHSASDPGFPYAGAAIGTGSMWGFDVGDPGLNALLTPRVYPNGQWRDMMSYCNNQWISDYTYNGIYTFLDAFAATGAPTRPVRAGSDTIALFGTIYDASDTAAFQVVGLWDSPGPYAPPSGGAYRMRFLDAGGTTIQSYDFDGEASDADPTHYGFEVVVPFPAATARIELERKSDGEVLATHGLSANAPTISDVALVGASEPVSGTVTLQWQASDPDGDPLLFDVYYTDDGGATYTAYALALSEPTVQLDSTQLAGSGQARFRVTANDGTRTAEAESAPFTMAPKPPTITFLAPQDGLEVTYGTPVNFLAEVEDLQGDVPDGSMAWYLNGAATGATGPAYTAYLLPVGTNQVSLRATNSLGQSSERSVTVIVNDDVDYPGPTLIVGPDQLGWQVAAGNTTPQQGTLTISNQGTGSLSWTASEDAPWLSLSATSGDAPGTLGVIADPALVPPGEPVSAVIAISGSNGQTLHLPVSLTVGTSPVWADDPDPVPGSETYLSIILR